MRAAPNYHLQQPWAFLRPWAHWTFFRFPTGFPCLDVNQMETILPKHPLPIQVSPETLPEEFQMMLPSDQSERKVVASAEATSSGVIIEEVTGYLPLQKRWNLF